MSWFDTAGLASLAKTALKEAQKTIDKALDIQDDGNGMTSSTTSTTLSAPEAKSKTEPTTPLQPLWPSSNPALWGSFTGSFFENPKASEMVTTPPKSGLNTAASENKRPSVTSNSDSVELLSSSPTTPCSSAVTSPSVTGYHSESVDILTTPNSSEILSPDWARSPDSVEVITSDELADEDDDSMSFSTVMDDSLIPATIVTAAPGKSATGLATDTSTRDSSKFETDSCDSSCTLVATKQSSTQSVDDSFMDSQTLLSDSTQSFEDVQIPDATIDDKDMVKIGSGPNSGHTSADEVETATSSDIEIISNPNGDSSSTNSACRSSPMKTLSCGPYKKGSRLDCASSSKKGHNRELSETSIQSDDSQLSSHSETDKLLHRIAELSEVIEAREIRLMELGRENAELYERNAEYQTLLDAKQKRSDHIDAEEYTHRLSALEKKFQAIIRERDALRDQLKAARNELATKISKDNLDRMIADKDFMIAELRTEGEKLSKQVLQHSNIIKKLRAKEKETDSQLKKYREEITEMADEVERSKKSLAAKEEVERTQIEAVHKLSSEKRKLEKENQSMRSQLEDVNSRLETLQISLDAAKKELSDRQNAQSELSRKTEALATLESERQLARTQNEENRLQLDDLRAKLRLAETGNTVREQKLRQDNGDLLRRLEAAELRAEELAQEVSLATIPLVRQLEALQTTLTTRTNSWEKQEKVLLSRFEEAQTKLKQLENVEETAKSEQTMLNTRIKSLEERLSASLLKTEQTTSLLQQAEIDFNLKSTDYQRQIERLKTQLEESTYEANELREKYKLLEKSIASERERHTKELSEQSERHDVSQESNTLQGVAATVEGQQDATDTNSASPTISIGRNSISESLGSSAWQMDDLENISNSGRQMATSIYGIGANLGQMGYSATMLETLQSTLKQRDGEVSQLQWELSRLQADRAVLNSEISNISLELENVKEKLAMHEELEKEFTELQRKYDALLQMYGEKVEEAQELELDLQDVKEMYKAQIDELLRQKNGAAANSPSA